VKGRGAKKENGTFTTSGFVAYVKIGGRKRKATT
jgi:hypothetical protein